MAKTKKIDSGATASPMQNDDWQHEDHARTLMKAGEIMSDPDKMAGAMKHVRKQKKAFKTIDQVKKFAAQKYAPKHGPDGDPNMNGAEDMEG